VSTWKQRTTSQNSLDNSQNQERVHFIADYCAQRKLSFSEVKQALWHRGISNINCVPVQPFNTLEAGFTLQQLALNDNVSEESFFYVNVAPRKDSKSARENNEGESLVYVELDSGAKIVTTSGGFTLSLVKDNIEELRSIEVSTGGSQFRSRDIFPEAVASIAKGEKKLLGETLEEDFVPEPPQNRVGYIDGFGNIKTTIRKSEIGFKLGDRIHLKVSAAEVGLEFQDGIFGVEEGGLVLAPGSSGGKDSFLEIVKRGGSAEKELGKPEVGDRIELI